MQTIVLIIALVSIASLVTCLYVLLKVRSLNSRLNIILNSLRSRSIKSYIKLLESKRRIRKRYLVVRFILRDEGLDKGRIQELLREAYRVIYGGKELSVSEAKVIEYFESKLVAIIRFRSSERWKLLVALGGIERMSKGRILPIPLRVCGTLRKAEDYIKKMKF